MAANYGAHEVMEIHEILSNSINAINQMQLLRAHVQDQQLMSMLDGHLQFAIEEYNNMVQALQQRGITEAIPYRRRLNTSASYGLRNPQTQTPNMSANQMDDNDVASAVLGIHKASATTRMSAALECVDPELRYNIQQGANNCAEQAYEIWQYMNQKGFYQVPTMKEMTTQTMMNTYGPAPMGTMGQTQQQFTQAQQNPQQFTQQM